MKEGLAADDIWIMVEDELLDTAKLFTRYLHKAEYQKLKAQVKMASADRLNPLPSAATEKGKASQHLLRRFEAEAKEKAQEDATSKLPSSYKGKERAADDSDDETAPWMFEPHLGKLMRRPPPKAKSLLSTTGTKSTSRAAAGFPRVRQPSSPRQRSYSTSKTTKSRERNGLSGLAKELALGTASDDEDDLDAPARTTTKFPIKPLVKTARPSASALKPFASSTTARATPSSGSHRSVQRESGTSKRPRTDPPNSASQPEKAVRKHDPFSYSSPGRSLFTVDRKSESLLASQTSSVSTARERIMQRKLEKAKREKAKEQPEKTVSLDEIPTFLF